MRNDIYIYIYTHIYIYIYVIRRLKVKGLNGLVSFADRRNLVSVLVPSHFKRSLRRLVTPIGW